MAFDETRPYASAKKRAYIFGLLPTHKGAG
jgi:hypothetical protein